MRVLIISQHFWPETFRINDLVESLLERGHEVDVLTAIPNYPAGKFFGGYGWLQANDQKPARLAKAHVRRLWIIPRGTRKSVQLALNYISFIIGSSLICLTTKRRYDCCFVFATSPLLQAIAGVLFRKRTQTPLIVWVQDLWPESLSAVKAIKARWILQLVAKVVTWIYKHSSLILVQSRGFVPKVQELGAAADRIRYFPNWAEDVYSSEWVSTDHLPNGFKIVFAGNLGRAQGLQVILEAAEHLRSEPDLLWVMIGDGGEKNRLEDEVAKRGLTKKFLFAGRRPVEEMPSYFSQADALLVTLSDDPIFAITIPSKIQSYLAAGKPLLGALNGEGAQLIINSRVGLASEALDGRALAANVLALKKMTPAEREAMGIRGREIFSSEFNRGKLVSQLEIWMRELST